MALLALFVLVLAAATVPDVAPGTLGIDRNPPDLWVAVVAYLALRSRGFSSVRWAILLGLVRDATSLDPLGTHAFVLGFVAWLFAEGAGHRGRVDGLSRVLIAGLAALVAHGAYLLRILPFADGAVTWSSALAAFPTALWTMVLAAPLYSLLDASGALDDLCGRPRGLPA
jgi:rod shape-determining protein MreD